MKTKEPKYISELKRIASSVAFSVSRQENESFRWDCDGPDPRRRGYIPCDVTVSARVIVLGEIVSAETYLGGSYYKPAEPCGDVHGYLPQMLQECAEELSKNPKLDFSARTSLDAAIAHLANVMRQEYEAQRKECAK